MGFPLNGLAHVLIFWRGGEEGVSVLRCPQPDVFDVQLLPATGELDLDGISGGGVGEQGGIRPEARLERARGCGGCGQGAQCGVWQRGRGRG